MSQAEFLRIYSELAEIVFEKSPWKLAIPEWNEERIRNFVQGVQLRAKSLLFWILSHYERYGTTGTPGKTIRVGADLDLGIDLRTDVLYYPDRIVLGYNPEEKACFDFLEALGNFPIDSIHKCERCKAYFLKGTKRNKRFCSPKCYYASAQAERRKKLETKGGEPV